MVFKRKSNMGNMAIVKLKATALALSVRWSFLSWAIKIFPTLYRFWSGLPKCTERSFFALSSTLSKKDVFGSHLWKKNTNIGNGIQEKKQHGEHGDREIESYCTGSFGKVVLFELGNKNLSDTVQVLVWITKMYRAELFRLVIYLV